MIALVRAIGIVIAALGITVLLSPKVMKQLMAFMKRGEEALHSRNSENCVCRYPLICCFTMQCGRCGIRTWYPVSRKGYFYFCPWFKKSKSCG